jgi:hypothetical protein
VTHREQALKRSVTGKSRGKRNGSTLPNSQGCTIKLLTQEDDRLLSVFGSPNKWRKKVIE